MADEGKERFNEMLQKLDARTLKTSVLLRQFITLSMRGNLTDGKDHALLQQRIQELGDEVDRRLP